MKRLTVMFLVLYSMSFAQPNEYFQQQVKYKIEVTLNAENKTYNGTEKVTYKNNSPQSLHYVWFHFYPNAYKDESTPYAKQQEKFRYTSFHFSKKEQRGYLELVSAKINGQELNWEYKEDAIDEIKINLPVPLEPGTEIQIDLEFSGKFPEKLVSRMQADEENYFSVTQWYPKVVVYNRDGWHPDSYLDIGEFYGEFADYDVHITLPDNFIYDATGMLQQNPGEEKFIAEIVRQTGEYLKLKTKKERNQFLKKWKKERRHKTDFVKMKTVHFVANNVHDFAWFCGDLYMMYQLYHNDGVLTNVLVKPANAYGWQEVPRYVEQAVWFYSEHVGKYEHPKASVVDGGRQGGGMEYPMITEIDFPEIEFLMMLEMVVAHEVGHNWFQGMLGNDERKEPFLDEGLNSFYEYKYMEHYHGFYNLSNFQKLTKIDILQDIGLWHYMYLTYNIPVITHTEQPMNLRSEDYTLLNFVSAHYNKAVFTLLALEWLMGEEKFSQAMHQYFNTWKGKHPSVDDFFAIMSDVSGQNLDWFYDEWYTKTTTNDFVIRKKKTRTVNNGYETDIYIKNKGSMKGMPAPIYLITTADDTLEGRWQGDSKIPVVISHQAKIKKAEVNLKRIIFETNYLNNSSIPDFDVNLIGQLPRFDTYPINFYPFYWYEEFKDKNRIGLGFWSGNPSFNQFVGKGSFYYAPESEEWGYALGVKHRFVGWLLNYTNVSANIRDKNGLKNISFQLETVYMKKDDDGIRWTFGLAFDKVKLYDISYCDDMIFEPYDYTTLAFGSRFVLKKMLHRFTANLNVEKSLDVFHSQADYLKLSCTSMYQYRLSRKLFGQIRLFGSGVWGDDIPSQERIYIGGSVDPKHKRFAFARRGGMAPLRSWTYFDGMNMPGYARLNGMYPSGKAGASLCLELEYARFNLPLVYATVGTLSQQVDDFGSDDFISEIGVKYDVPFMTFIIPFYISDPASGKDNFDFRFLFQIDFSKNFRLTP